MRDSRTPWLSRRLLVDTTIAVAGVFGAAMVMPFNAADVDAHRTLATLLLALPALALTAGVLGAHWGRLVRAARWEPTMAVGGDTGATGLSRAA